ncbi:MAG: hypothetical protein BZ151_01850 [Desulfobacca sp. 4484_104]|nr:MAG: hypothetical protein BZ151_01850 [Desulfobacca sp. 4484_104]
MNVSRDRSGFWASVRGFTLLEILVAMVLVSTVTLIAAMALHLTVNTWARGRREGEVGVLRVTLPLLIEHQLTSLVEQAEFPARKKLPFNGGEKGFSFFTTYAPRGAAAGGLLWVAYRYGEDEKSLEVYVRVVTRAEQLTLANDPLSSEWNREQEAVSRLTGIDGMTIEYTTRATPVFTEDDYWSEKCDKTPTGIRLILTLADGGKVEKWFFLVRGGRV